MKTLINVCLKFSRIFVVVDALDEVENKHQKEVVRILKELQAVHVKVLVTRRPHTADIFKKFAADIQRYIETHENDMQVVLTRSLAESDNMEGISDTDLEKEIVQNLARMAHGMFLLPALQIQAIMEQVSKTGTRAILRPLSSDLDESFGGFI